MVVLLAVLVKNHFVPIVLQRSILHLAEKFGSERDKLIKKYMANLKDMHKNISLI